jgi:hypothetical protein
LKAILCSIKTASQPEAVFSFLGIEIADVNPAQFSHGEHSGGCIFIGMQNHRFTHHTFGKRKEGRGRCEKLKMKSLDRS